MTNNIEARSARLVKRPPCVRLLALALLVSITAHSAPIPTSTVTPGPTVNSTLPPEGQSQTQPAPAQNGEAQAAPKISPEELNSLVAPIALYPDPLLIQVLAASTYPLEVIQLKQWMDDNKKLKGKILMDAVAEQKWDSSVQALVAFPTVVEKLANHIQWTTDLGNAFLAQESDVMDTVQALRAKAQGKGALKTNDKQTVATETGNDGRRAITIEPAQQGTVYVPAYSTQVVYGDSNSSGYSGYSTDSDYGGYSGSGSDSGYSYIGYTVAAAYGAYWGYYNWRDRYAEVDYNNRYNYRFKNNSESNWRNDRNWSNRVNNLSRGDKGWQRASGEMGRWQHDPGHRGNAPYGNRDLANRFGQGTNRFGQGSGNRAFEPREADPANQLARGNRPSELSRANAGNQLARGNFSPGQRSMRPPNADAANRIGNRMPSNWPNGARGGAFGPRSGDAARAFSSRGAQSMRPPGEFRGGPPGGMRAGGPPAGGFRGGPPMGGGMPMGGGPPMGGGIPMGGAPPPPPPPHP